MRKKKLGAAMLAMVVLLCGCGASANKGEGAYKLEGSGSPKKTESLADGGSWDGVMDADRSAGWDMSSSVYGEGGGMSGGAYESKGEDMMTSPMGDMPMERPAGDMAMEPAMADSMAIASTPTSYDDAIENGEVIISEPEEEWFPEDEPIEPIKPMPGLLTAGEWCDNQNWGFMANLANTGRFDFWVYGMKPYERVVLHVLSAGEAASNVKAELMDAEGNKLAEAVTDYAGIAYLYYNVYDGDAGEPAYVIVNANNTVVRAELTQDAEQTDIEPKCPVAGEENPWDSDGQDTAELTQDGEQTDVELEYPVTGEGNPWDDDGQGAAEGQDPQVSAHLTTLELTVEITDYVRPAKRLDVMFVFDTTGSMGDELLYLQKEFEDIAAQVADQSTRFSVNFYRDFEDEYVVRSNEFISDIDRVMELLNAEYADGGGDYEEAVDLALVNAVLEHDWNTDSVKLMFLILDAPPHNTAEVVANLKKAVSAASAMGIRIIPIASSGVDTATEALLRNIAMLTGGTYTFLTNDSGIGGEHLEPTIGSYTVEMLNDLIVRLIRQYYQ